MKHDIDIEKPRLEPARNDERIAAVIAGSREYQHARWLRRKEIARDGGGSKPGAFHQRRVAGFGFEHA